MPDLTMTFTTAQVAKLKTAFATKDIDGNSVDATQDDIEAACRQFLIATVRRETERTEQIAASAAAATTMTDGGWDE